MPSSQQRKGFTWERRIVKAMQAIGVPARRMPLSGAGGGPEHNHDVAIKAVPGHAELQVEIKARKDGSGWKTVEGWLGHHDLLVMIEDRRSPLVTMRWNTLLELLKAIDRGVVGGRDSRTNSSGGRESEREPEDW